MSVNSINSEHFTNYVMYASSCFCVTKVQVHSTPSFVIVLAFLKETERKKMILENEKKHHGTVDESSLEQQFHKLDKITFLCEKSGVILLVLMGPMQAVRQEVRRNTGRFGNSLWIALLGFSWRLTKVQCYYNVTNAFQSVF